MDCRCPGHSFFCPTSAADACGYAVCTPSSAVPCTFVSWLLSSSFRWLSLIICRRRYEKNSSPPNDGPDYFQLNYSKTCSRDLQQSQSSIVSSSNISATINLSSPSACACLAAAAHPLRNAVIILTLFISRCKFRNYFSDLQIFGRKTPSGGRVSGGEEE